MAPRAFFTELGSRRLTEVNNRRVPENRFIFDISPHRETAAACCGCCCSTTVLSAKLYRAGTAIRRLSYYNTTTTATTGSVNSAAAAAVAPAIKFSPTTRIPTVFNWMCSAARQQVSRSPTSEDERGVVNKLDEAIEREVRPWLDLVDSLRAQGIQDELSLPQVCVVLAFQRSTSINTTR